MLSPHTHTSHRMTIMHVLLIEDSPINRRFIGLALSKVGIRSTDAENGRLGVEKAIAGQHDAILMDMQMPVMDGFQATAHLRQLGLATPIIALTGHSTAEDRERCLQAGCNDHLTKPVATDDLLDALNRAVTLPDVARDLDEFSHELRQIALDYLDMQRHRLDEMKESLENADFESLAELAHRVKGTAGTVGFPQFTAPAEGLEAAALSAKPQACESVLKQIVALQAQAETLA